MTTGTPASHLDNCASYWCGFGTQYREVGEVSLYRSGLLDPQLNGVLRVRAGARPLAAAVDGAARRLEGLPALWWVGPDSDPGLLDHLLGQGGSQVAQMPVMTLGTALAPPPARPDGLEVREVADPEVGSWVRAYAAAFGVAQDQVPGLVGAERARPDPPADHVRLAGLLDGEVVGTAALLDRHGVGGIYVVTVAEGFRRRGIGAAMTLAAVQEARRRGLPAVTLQATPDGEPLYRRLGFEVVATYRLVAF